MTQQAPLVIGYDFTLDLTFTTDGAVLDMTGYEVTGVFFYRGKNPDARLSPENILLTVVSGDGKLTATDIDEGEYQLTLDGDDTAALDPSPLNLPGPSRVLMCRFSRTDSSNNTFLADIAIKVSF